MPKHKGYMKDVPLLYKFESMDIIIFGYVTGLKRAFPKISTTDAIKMALEKFELCEEIYCFNACKTAYYTVLSAFMRHHFKE